MCATRADARRPVLQQGKGPAPSTPERFSALSLGNIVARNSGQQQCFFFCFFVFYNNFATMQGYMNSNANMIMHPDRSSII